ncbi:MAG: DUF2892 domain-containing protein [Candidatus Margulisiibacteriota bacterium]
MDKNMGMIDRVLRIVLALAVGLLFFQGLLTGLAAVILGVLAVIFLVTSVVGVCPLYSMFGIKTCKAELAGPKCEVSAPKEVPSDEIKP